MSTILFRSFAATRIPPRPPLVLILSALAALGSAHGAPRDPNDDSARAGEETPGPVRRFLSEHGIHLLVATAADYLTKIYSDSVGPSEDPLLFASPGALDTRLRKEISGPAKERGFIENEGLEALRLAVPVALVGFNVGDGAAMARDLAGYAELYFMKRAAVRFAKDLIGRERPALEFAAEDGHGPKKIASLEARDGNHQSFPSGHASGSFAWAGYLDRVLARKFGARSTARLASFTTLYGLAGYISWSRLRRDKHYFSDVAAGGAAGIAMSRYYYRLNHPDEYPRRRSGAAVIALRPPVPVPGGIAVTVDIQIGRPPGAITGGGAASWR